MQYEEDGRASEGSESEVQGDVRPAGEPDAGYPRTIDVFESRLFKTCEVHGTYSSACWTCPGCYEELTGDVSEPLGE